MTRFAFVIHPISARDVARKYPMAKFFPDGLIESAILLKKPMVASEITGIRSAAGAETEGWFIILPLTPRQMTQTLPVEKVYDKIVQCTEIAANKGAEIIGLGAFTSVVGDGGVTVASRSKIAVTTGNSYTIATAIQGTLLACDQLDIDPSRASLAVVGATGSIGKTCARILGEKFATTALVGRDLQKTQAVAKEIGLGNATTDLTAIHEADVIVTVTSSEGGIIQPQHLKPGAVVCDVARPRDVSTRVGKERPDVLVLEGGVISVPGNVDFHFNFGFPERTAYACMSETIILALEGRPENFTLGKDVSVQQVEEMMRLAEKHGFKLAGFRSFEKAVSEEAVSRAKAARGIRPAVHSIPA